MLIHGISFSLDRTHRGPFHVFLLGLRSKTRSEKSVYQKILLPLDGSNEAEKRVDEAVSLMKLTNGELILFHVVDVVPLWGHGIEKDYQFRKDRFEKHVSEIKSRVEYDYGNMLCNGECVHMNYCFFLKLWLLILAVLFIPQTALCDPVKTDAEKKKTVYEMYERYKRDFPTVEDMTPQEAMKLTAEGRVVFVDVRKPAERKVSKLPYTVTKEEFIENPSKFKSKTVVTYCTISYRSGKFAMDMEKKGIRMYNLKGGMLAWVFEGGKVFDENGQTNRVHVYGEKWNYLPEGYEAVMFGFFEKYFN